MLLLERSFIPLVKTLMLSDPAEATRVFFGTPPKNKQTNNNKQNTTQNKSNGGFLFGFQYVETRGTLRGKKKQRNQKRRTRALVFSVSGFGFRFEATPFQFSEAVTGPPDCRFVEAGKLAIVPFFFSPPPFFVFSFFPIFCDFLFCSFFPHDLFCFVF